MTIIIIIIMIRIMIRIMRAREEWLYAHQMEPGLQGLMALTGNALKSECECWGVFAFIEEHSLKRKGFF